MSALLLTGSDSDPVAELRPHHIDALAPSRWVNGLSPAGLGASFIYFIGSEDRFVKIGQSSDVMRRLASLQSSSPVLLTFILAVRGSFQTERDLHAVFNEYRERGEWYRREGALARFLEEAPK